MVVKNGFLPERSILTGIGPLSVKQPRVRDKREDKEVFTSKSDLFLTPSPSSTQSTQS